MVPVHVFICLQNIHTWRSICTTTLLICVIMRQQAGGPIRDHLFTQTSLFQSRMMQVSIVSLPGLSSCMRLLIATHSQKIYFRRANMALWLMKFLQIPLTLNLNKSKSVSLVVSCASSSAFAKPSPPFLSSSSVRYPGAIDTTRMIPS